MTHTACVCVWPENNSHPHLSSEPLVCLQWENDSGEYNTGGVQPGPAVWRGGCWSWCHGQSVSLSLDNKKNR